MIGDVDCGEAFMTALYAALGNDTALGALLSAQRVAAGGAALSAPFPCYPDAAPPNEPRPYVVWNIVSDNQWNTADGVGAELLVDVHAFTQGASPAGALALRKRINALCTDPAWSLTGANLVYCRPERRRCDAEGDGFHAVVTLRALIET